mmetsp:Transcript_49860/g.132405  ORF Transcript_49860/g.132405 Transcript_49860/m.132405 type:complete len:778 (-) Transcript_49860:127-2460(-)
MTVADAISGVSLAPAPCEADAWSWLQAHPGMKMSPPPGFLDAPPGLTMVGSPLVAPAEPSKLLKPNMETETEVTTCSDAGGSERHGSEMAPRSLGEKSAASSDNPSEASEQGSAGAQPPWGPRSSGQTPDTEVPFSSPAEASVASPSGSSHCGDHEERITPLPPPVEVDPHQPIKVALPEHFVAPGPSCLVVATLDESTDTMFRGKALNGPWAAGSEGCIGDRRRPSGRKQRQQQLQRRAQESEQSPAFEHPVPPGLPLENTPDLQQSGPSQTLAMGGRPVMQMPQFMANDPRTSMFSTAMLRNIPNRYTRKMLVDRLDDGFRGGFDFVYMPIDFSKQCNMGYAFINFKDPLTCRRFMRTFHGVRSKDCLLSCNSPKVCEVTFARLQGLKENVCSLQNSPIMDQLAEHEEWQPLLFDDHGDPVPFPKQKIAMDDEDATREARNRRRRSRNDADSWGRPRIDPRDCVPGGLSHARSLPRMTTGGVPFPWGVPSYGAQSSPYGLQHPWAGAMQAGMPPLHPGLGPARPSVPHMIPSMPQWQPGLTQVHSVPHWAPAGTESVVPTTVMLQSIPNSCTRDQLMDRLNYEFAGTFDFLYLPIDFKTNSNVGYAFINFKDMSACCRFASTFHGVEASLCLPGFHSEKVCHVTPARVQGLEANVHRLRQSNIGDQLAGHPDWQPLIFDDSGVPTAFLVSHRSSRSSLVAMTTPMVADHFSDDSVVWTQPDGMPAEDASISSMCWGRASAGAHGDGGYGSWARSWGHNVHLGQSAWTASSPTLSR